MGQKVKIAGVQMDPKMLQKERNLARCLQFIQLTANEGARLIIFPECALTGYIFSSLEEALPMAEPIPGPSTDKMLDVCNELNVYVVMGLLEKDGDKCYNACVLLGPQGLVGKHRKVHLPYLGVDRFVDYGDIPFSVYDTAVGRIGMGICYDGLFPEHARVLALEGADIVVLPTNWPRMTQGTPKYVIPTRAMENHIFYAAVNRVGEERGVKFFGRSRIAYWLGILADGKPYEEDVLYAEIEPAKAREKHMVVRPGEFEVHLFKDRRPEFYGSITKKPVDSSQ
jgi:predicted amidohydrolase